MGHDLKKNKEPTKDQNRVESVAILTRHELRKQKLSEKLRENLSKRKLQARARKDSLQQ